MGGYGCTAVILHFGSDDAPSDDTLRRPIQAFTLSSSGHAATTAFIDLESTLRIQYGNRLLTNEPDSPYSCGIGRARLGLRSRNDRKEDFTYQPVLISRTSPDDASRFRHNEYRVMRPSFDVPCASQIVLRALGIHR